MKSIKKAVHNLRKQPEESRRHILHALTFFLGLVLFLFWTYSLGKDIADPTTQRRLKEDLQPFAELKDTLVNDSQTANVINLEAN